MACDAAERKALRLCGRVETWKARHVALCLHLRHNFTRVCATDGSRTMDKGQARVSYGIWRGVQPGEGDEDACVTAGLSGGALPTEYTIHDAEMYAMLVEVRAAVRAMEETGEAQRCLILSDCQAVLQRVEKVWRAGGTASYRGMDQGGMLEEMCVLRDELRRGGGHVVTCWVPSHRGNSANAYADAVAKAYLGEPVDGDVAVAVARRVESRPCVYTVQGEGQLRDRRLYAEGTRRAADWALGKTRANSTMGILAGWEGPVWEGVVRAVGAGRAGAGKTKEMEAADDGILDARDKENARVELTYQLRVGSPSEVEHERAWQRRRAAEGTGGGKATWSGEHGCVRCGCLADAGHVLMGGCRGALGTDIYLSEMCAAMTELSKAVPRREADLRTPIREWQCACVREVRLAQAAFQDAKAGRTVSARRLAAAVRVLAGVLPACIAMRDVDEKKAKVVERKVASVIARAQDTVLAYKAGRWAVMREAREAQNAVWDDAWDVLAAAKAEAEEERKAQAQQLAEHVRAQAEQHAPARAAASNGTATATAGGVRSRRARAEARQAKRPRDELSLIHI